MKEGCLLEYFLCSLSVLFTEPRTICPRAAEPKWAEASHIKTILPRLIYVNLKEAILQFRSPLPRKFHLCHVKTNKQKTKKIPSAYYPYICSAHHEYIYMSDTFDIYAYRTMYCHHAFIYLYCVRQTKNKSAHYPYVCSACDEYMEV